MESSSMKIMSINDIVDYFTSDPTEYIDGDKVEVITINVVFFPSKVLTVNRDDYTTFYFYPYAVNLFANVDGKKQHCKLEMKALKEDLGDFAIKLRKRPFKELNENVEANVLSIKTEESKYKSHAYYKYTISPLSFKEDSPKYKQMIKDFQCARQFHFATLDGDTLL